MVPPPKPDTPLNRFLDEMAATLPDVGEIARRGR
jgi:hypothetical protein